MYSTAQGANSKNTPNDKSIIRPGVNNESFATVERGRPGAGVLDRRLAAAGTARSPAGVRALSLGFKEESMGSPLRPAGPRFLVPSSPLHYTKPADNSASHLPECSPNSLRNRRMDGTAIIALAQ
jgi:hypothetical protein